MRRTSKKTKKEDYSSRLNDRDQKIALELFRSDSFLVINKNLLKKLGPIKAIFLENLVDKYKYWKDKGMLDDDSFFLTHEDQMEQTGMSEYQIRECKKYMIELGILKTSMKGIPAKEHYTLDFECLVDLIINDEMPELPALGNSKGNTSNLQTGNTSNLQTGIYKDNIYKDNIYNNIIGFKEELENNLENEENEKEIKKNNSSSKEKNSEFLPLASKLANIIQSNKNIKVTQSKLNNWSNEIRKLSQIEGVAPARIEKALDWYAENIGGQYIPVIESGASLRNKFISLEEAMRRAGALDTNKPKSEVKGSSPKKIIKESLGELSSTFERECYLPARDIISNADSRNDKSKLAEALVDMYENIQEIQEKNIPAKSRHLFPDAISIINSYITWIEDNDWIKDRSINLFTVNHFLFNKFRREEASKDNMERDPLTGKSYLRE